MPGKLIHVRRLTPLLLLLPLLAGPSPGHGQPASPTAANLDPAEAQTLVQRALATELRTAQDPDHPMRYRLHKTSPRLTSTKEILETKDGDVARLVAFFD